MKRKIYILLLGCFLTVGAAGCGSSKPVDSASGYSLEASDSGEILEQSQEGTSEENPSEESSEQALGETPGELSEENPVEVSGEASGEASEDVPEYTKNVCVVSFAGAENVRVYRDGEQLEKEYSAGADDLMTYDCYEVEPRAVYKVVPGGVRENEPVTIGIQYENMLLRASSNAETVEMQENSFARLNHVSGDILFTGLIYRSMDTLQEQSRDVMFEQLFNKFQTDRIYVSLSLGERSAEYVQLSVTEGTVKVESDVEDIKVLVEAAVYHEDYTAYEMCSKAYEGEHGAVAADIPMLIEEFR